MDKKTRLLQWFVTFLVAAAPALAYNIGTVQVVDVLFTDQSVNETVAIAITGNNNSIFSFSLPEGARDIYVNDVYFNSSTTLDIPLNCTKCDVKVIYTLDSVVEKQAGNFIFSRTLNFPETPASLDYRIKIPPGYIVDLSLNQSEPSIVPSPTDTITDGKNFIVVWLETSPELPIRYFVKYEESTEQAAAKKLWFSPAIFAAILAALAGGAAGYYLSGLRKKHSKAVDDSRFSKPPAAKPDAAYIIPEMLLSPDEKTILRLLLEHEKEMNQKEVVLTLGWSKSKVSAIMSNLEYKTIIKREKFGRNYKVKIVREIAWAQG